MEEKYEFISAFMDGELSSDQYSSFMTQLTEDPELIRAWLHYHLIRDTLKGHLSENIIKKISQ